MAEVLLVDDDGSVLVTTTIALRRHGHNVTAARDGWQALGLLSDKSFEILVSDVRMPGMSGLELAAAARQMETPPRVILTSAQSVEVGDELAEAFLPKPLDTDELVDILWFLSEAARESNVQREDNAQEHGQAQSNLRRAQHRLHNPTASGSANRAQRAPLS